MEGLLKTYARRLARKHVLQNIGPSGAGVLETEKQLLEMALSRLREGLLTMPERPKASAIADIVRREASVLIQHYAEDEELRRAATSEVAALADDEILPSLH